MPFTFAHPAAVLPLRRWLPLPALTAGALAPDLAYYLPVPGGADRTHSVTGLYTTDLVLGAALTLIGYLVLAPVLALAPMGWRARAVPPDPARWRGPRAIAVAVCALVVGAVTHLGWDAFTHTGGAAVRALPFLRAPVIGPHRLYNVLGYASSAGGLLVLGALAVRWYRRTAPEQGERWRALPHSLRAWTLCAFVVSAAAGAVVALGDPVREASAYDWVRLLLIGAVQGGCAALAAYVLAWHLAPPGRR
ncbi:DUF4184 family protein [Amycolatopsis sp. CA-230715]|uniref:DUF4184 family protein n=1 Tax=Amycolatopsis sp. CA-230715 TaxID=2745196 RepID=UPI001C02CCFC|nr:DUF4184 family protein [Amycolatopsis sp. CA-230715]QWF82312.1 hypothetical protein HUW46_05749 [Amycolatopsis sp. CA-230715]